MDPQPVGLVGAALGVPALFSMTWPDGLVYSRGSEICSAGRDIDCCSLGRLTRLNQLEAVPFSSIVDAPRARSRPPPPPRRPPLTASIAAIPATIINATPVAITASDCATIDATLASKRPLPADAPHRAGPTWHGHHRLHRRFPRPTAATAFTRVAIIAPATILAATSGAAERRDVWEGLSALLPPL